MKATPWFRYHRVGNALLKESIIEAINRCGVALEPAQKSPPMGSGLLLFDGMDRDNRARVVWDPRATDESTHLLHQRGNGGG
jgi:hypothetical protein